jgi:hypothetical protein
MAEHAAENRSTGGANIDAIVDSIKNDRWVPVMNRFKFTPDQLFSDGKHRGSAIIRGGRWLPVLVTYDVPLLDMHAEVNTKPMSAGQYLARVIPSELKGEIGGQTGLNKLVGVMRLALDPALPRKVKSLRCAWRVREIKELLMPKGLNVIPLLKGRGVHTRNVAHLAFMVAAYHMSHDRLVKAANVYMGKAKSIPGFEIMHKVREHIELVHETLGKHAQAAYLVSYVNLQHALKAIIDGEGDTAEIIGLHEFDGSVTAFRGLETPIWWPQAILDAVPEFWRP